MKHTVCSCNNNCVQKRLQVLEVLAPLVLISVGKGTAGVCEFNERQTYN